MAVSRFSTSSVAQGLPKYQKFWDGTAAVFASDFESIATVTVGSGGASYAEFTSIPSTYKYLQIRYITQASNGAYLSMQVNGDTATNYTWGYLNGDGSSLGGGRTASEDRIALPRGSATANIFGVGVVDIYDYANTNKFTTVRGVGGRNINSAGQYDYNYGFWRNTSSVTSIKLYHSGVNLTQYSQFALYGVK